MYPNLALSGSKNEGARTDSVFIPISQVYPLGKLSKKGGRGLGRAKKIGAFFCGVLTTLDFLKMLEARTVFNSLINCQWSTK